MKKLLVSALGLLVLVSGALNASDKTGWWSRSDAKNDDEISWWNRYKYKLGAGALALGAAGYYGYRGYQNYRDRSEQRKQYMAPEPEYQRIQKIADDMQTREQQRAREYEKYPSKWTAGDFREHGKPHDFSSRTFQDLRNTEQWLRAPSHYDSSKTTQQFIYDRYQKQQSGLGSKQPGQRSWRAWMRR